MLKLPGEKAHHGDTENTERLFPRGLLAAALESMQLSDLPKPAHLDYHLVRIVGPFNLRENIARPVVNNFVFGAFTDRRQKEAPCWQL